MVLQTRQNESLELVHFIEMPLDELKDEYLKIFWGLRIKKLFGDCGESDPGPPAP